MSKYCSECGTEVPEGSKFCPNCGFASGASGRAGNQQTSVPITSSKAKDATSKTTLAIKAILGTLAFFFVLGLIFGGVEEDYPSSTSVPATTPALPPPTHAPTPTPVIPESTPTPNAPHVEIASTTEYIDRIPSGVYNLFPKLEISSMDFEVTNNGTDVVEVVVSSEISGYTDKAINREQIAPGKTKTIGQMPLFKPGVLDTLTETRTANLHYKVAYLEDGKETTWDEQTVPVDLYAKDTMVWGVVEDGEYIDLSFFIAAWVTPHVSEIDELVRVAAEYHPQRRMVGYQGAETQEEQMWVSSDQVEAIYNALQDEYQITYISSSISYSANSDKSQRIKLPKDAINMASANCIDGTVLFASAIENIGIDPYIVLIPGHAFVAWDIWEGSDTIDCLETTLVSSYSFETANERGLEGYEREVENGNFDTGVSKLISIEGMRSIGITPMQ